MRESSATATLHAAFPGGFIVYWFAVAASAGFFATMMHGIDGGPGASLSLILRNAALCVTLFDVLSFPFLFVSVFIFVPSVHFSISLVNGFTYAKKANNEFQIR